MSEVTGTADNCSVFFRVQAMNNFGYRTFLLPDETPYILFKSHKAEYCFTDAGFITSFGDATLGKKRSVVRFDWCDDRLDRVSFETAGMSVTDMDCEVKFQIGSAYISVDIRKSETDAAIAAYRVLVELSRTQSRFTKKLKIANDSIAKSLSAPLDANSGALHFQLAHSLIETLNPISYREVFERLTPTQG